MKPLKYAIKKSLVPGSLSFGEATSEELRVLIALLCSEGSAESEEQLADLAKTSVPRTKAALTLWESEGVITQKTDNVTDEFDTESEQMVTSLETAATVRDQMLENMLRECSSLMEKPALSTEEIKAITYLYSELSLSPEYVLTLIGYLKETKKRLTPREIRRRGEILTERGYTTLEGLEVYIRSNTKEENDLWEIRRIIGIYNRNLSQSEIAYFSKWINELEMGTEIISEAYDIATVSTGSSSLPYMDKILTNWHQNGLKTVAECRAFSTQNKDAERKSGGRRKKSDEPKLRYGNFDIDEAIEAALERSFSNDEG